MTREQLELLLEYGLHTAFVASLHNGGDVFAQLVSREEIKQREERVVEIVKRLKETVGDEYTKSALNEARQLLADAKNSKGEIHEECLVDAISRVFVALYTAEGRLPKSRDVETGEVR